MPKTLSVAYCGGCNAAYDRPAFVRELLADVCAAGGEITLVDTSEPSDMALILAGCQALCVADRADFGPLAAVRHVVGPERLDAVSLPFNEIHARLKAELLR